MNRYSTEGIILRRVDFGEADRIITFITPNYGKVGAMARGVRKPKSKLAGGIELFSVSELSLIKGKGGLDQLVSSRLVSHFRDILSDFDKLEFAYRVVDYINRFTEDDAGSEYYEILKETLTALADMKVQLPTIKAWFYLQLMRTHGHLPNLLVDSNGEQLKEGTKYAFDIGEGSFSPSAMGDYGANEIKAWRILAQATLAETRRFKGIDEAAALSEVSLDLFTKHNL